MFTQLLEKIGRREDLTTAQAESAMHEVMQGRATDAQVAALLIGLSMKGEQPAEIVGFARAMRAASVRLTGSWDDVVDVCGTGGDHSRTFNISSLVAIVVAACGVRVAKHGNRAVSSACGSADFFEAVGVRTTGSVEAVERSLEGANLAFLFAPIFHPAMQRAAAVRRELGVRTAFNLLGPLTNPACPRRQLIGVPRAELTDLLARALLLLGSERAWVVHGADGLDEISTSGYTKVSECRGGAVRTFYIHPHDFGLPVSERGALGGGTAADNARIAMAVLSGSAGAARDVVLMNAAAMLVVAGVVADVRGGVARASDALDSGDALATLTRTRTLSQG